MEESEAAYNAHRDQPEDGNPDYFDIMRALSDEFKRKKSELEELESKRKAARAQDVD